MRSPDEDIIQTCRTPAITAIDTEKKSCDRHVEADLVHYIVVRSDLTRGQQVAQTIHAVGESHGGIVHPPGTIAVALAATDEQHLRDIYAMLCSAGLSPRLIEECDGEAMAIGIPPTSDRKSVKRWVSHLPLVK